MKVITAAEAAELVPDGGTVAIAGGGYRAVAESLLAALGDRFDETAHPAGIRLMSVSMLERTRGGVGGEGTGLNRLAKPGLLGTLIISSFSRAPDRELNALILGNHVAAYNYPMGTIVQLLRVIGTGRAGLATAVGIGTFVDPRVEGGRVNEAAAVPLNRVIEIEGEEMLYYPRFDLDIGFVKASAADDRGNLYMDRDAFDHGLLDVALATHNSGGLLIAEVNRLIDRGDVPARFVRVPGAMVDHVVVAVDDPWEDEQAELLLGRTLVELPSPGEGGRPRDVIARLAVDELSHGAIVNVGAGIPMYDVPEAARRGGRGDLYFTVEQGPVGGWPQVGGVARNPEAILSQLDVFDFYEGGGPDYSVLSFGQIDAHGNVNVSRFANMMPGCGGFTNIAHGVKNLIFCGTLTTGGLDLAIGDGVLDIRSEGRIQRFVDQVEQVTFNAALALARGHTITVVTERALFRVRAEGWVLERVAPGVDIERDVLAHIPFRVHADAVELMDAELFTSAVPV